MISKLAPRIAALSLAHPGTAIAVLAALTVALSLGATRLRSVSYLEGNLPPHDPLLGGYEELVSKFGTDQAVVFAVSCVDNTACEGIYDEQALALIRSLGEAAAAFPGVASVSSIATAGVMVSDGADLRAQRLADLSSAPQIEQFRKRVAQDPLVAGNLVSGDERTAAIIVRFENVSDAARNSSALGMWEDLRERAEARGFTLHATGIALRAALSEVYVNRDLALLTPVMVGLLALILYWVFRSLAAVGLALVTVGIPTVWSFGLMGWLDRPITPITSTLPIVVLVVGVTDAVHFLVRVCDLRSRFTSARELVLSVASEVGPPTTITAITSSLGFLSFLAGSIPNLRDFGLFVAVGIMGGWLTTFSLIPIATLRLRLREPRDPSVAFELGDQVLRATRETAHRRAVPVACVALLLLAIAGWGLSRLVPENDTMKLLGEGDPLVQSELFLREHLRPIDTIEVIYSVGNGHTILDPAELGRLEKMEQILSESTQGGSVISVLPVLRTSHRALMGSDEVPKQAGAASQLLLLARGASPRVVDQLVTYDHRSARMSVGYAWAGSREVNEDLRDVSDRLRETVDGSARVLVTGSLLLGNHLGDVILDNQVASFSTAFATIFLVILLYVRSGPLSLLGMIPNLFPVALILGFMGMAQINLDVGTAMIASIVLGVSVDDTIYFLSHYRAARSRGANVRDSVALTFAIAGKPALFASAVLALGFFVLGLSSFQSLALFGVLSGLAVLLAGASELFLMPAVLELTAARREQR